MVKRETILFHGLDETIRLYNDAAELLIPIKLGIRVLSYRLSGGENIFQVFEEQIRDKDKQEWQIFGGHRFWTAPEDPVRSYEIDGAPLEDFKITEDGVILTQRINEISNIKKQLHIKLDEKTSGVTLTHTLTNMNRWPIQIAPWALSVLKPDGFCAVALPERYFNLLPDRAVVMWPYANMNDYHLKRHQSHLTRKKVQDEPARLPIIS